MSAHLPQRFRQIHLDFHTGPAIPGVGRDFDPKLFADTFAEARVDSVTLFAKCHHGHLYYDTDHPARHPHLERNLLAEQIAALRSRNIRAPIYISLQCDEYAADTHPEWVALGADGSRIGRQPFSGDPFRWQILDMSSPYLDYLCAQVAEVLERFHPIDGLFFDMCWDQPSASNWTKAAMLEAGLDPAGEKDRTLHARRVAHGYMERITALVARHQAGVPIFFNSRPLIRLKEESRFLQHVEVEALPTGQWGYLYFPVNIRFVRSLGKPMLGMTGRFHKSWADFGGLRTASSLLYDCAQALAHGAACSVGDQLHPTGTLDPAVYDVIGEVYGHVEKCERWVRDTRAPQEIAVLYGEATPDNQAKETYDGVHRTLAPLGYQYQFLTPDDAWEAYTLIIVPGVVEVTGVLRERLERYREKGGRILREVAEGEPSPYTATYLRFTSEARGNLPDTDHVFYERGIRLTPRPGETVLARIVEPYFERAWNRFCSHAQTPPQPVLSPYAAGLVNASRTEARFALPVFLATARHANLACRQLLAAALALLLPEPILRLRAPSYVEAVVNHLPGKTVVHLLSFIPQKKTATLEMVEDAIPARHIRIAVRSTDVRFATLEPGGTPVPITIEGSYAISTLDWIEGHTLLVFHHDTQCP